jgi:uncharacterized OB-fold protein
MISDGGAAIILTSAERAADLPRIPVYLLGAAETTALGGGRDLDNLMRPWLANVARDVYASAGLGPSDIDALYIQDPIAVWVLQMLEYYGFCEIGEAGAFLSEGHTYPGSSLPVNTNGGQLSESYMWGWLHLCEAGASVARRMRPPAGSECRSGDVLLDHDLHEGSGVDHLDAPVMSYDKPLPDPADPLTGPFWQALAGHVLRAQQCHQCGTFRLPAAPLCPECLARGHQWVEIEASGSLWSYVVYRRALAAPFAEDIPYAVGIVELDHGLHLLSRINAPVDEITIGDRMMARCEDVAPGISLLTWVPDRSAHV